MSEKVINKILYDSEGNILDFKREEYLLGKNSKKYEILKDFIAFANHPSNEEKYIIIGVNEKEGLANGFESIQKLTDESQYQQLIENYIEPKLNFEYKSFTYKENRLAFFRLYDNNDRPYLIKKDAQNPITNEVEFRVGDGFIRIGSSTKRLSRTDLDLIYYSKYKTVDRKPDIKIIPTFKNPDEERFSNLSFQIIDISVENLSNKSLSFSIEMRLPRNKEVLIISEYNLHEFLNEKETKEKKYSRIELGTPVMYNVINPNIHFEENEDIIVENVKIVKLSQKSIENNLFQNTVLAKGNSRSIIEAIVIIRSDDFTDGPLNKRIQFKI